MLPVGLSVLPVASLLMAMQGTATVSAIVQGMARNPYEATVSEKAAFDASVAPAVGLGLKEGQLDLGLGYEPTFSYRGIGLPQEEFVTLMHVGHALISYGSKGYRLSLSEAGAIGKQTFAALRTAPLDPNAPKDPTAPRVDLIPTNARTVDILGESTTASFDYQWSHRVRSGAQASYSISGGANRVAQQTIPRQKMANGILSLDYLASRDDHFGASLNTSHIVISDGHDHLTSSATVSWARQFEKGISAQIGGGAFFGRTTSLDRTPLYTVSAGGAGSANIDFIRSHGTSLALTFGASIAPQVNYIVGVLQQRLQGTGALTWHLDQFTAALSGDAAQTFPANDPSAFRLVGAGVNTALALAKWLDLTASYRSVWQHSQNAALASVPRQWVATIGVALHPLPVKM